MVTSDPKPKIQLLEKPTHYKDWKRDFFLYNASKSWSYAVEYNVKFPQMLPAEPIRESVSNLIRSTTSNKINEVLKLIPQDLLALIQNGKSVRLLLVQVWLGFAAFTGLNSWDISM